MDQDTFLKAISPIGVERFIKKVIPFISSHRQQKINLLLSHRLSSIEVAVEAPADPHNAAAILRSADAFSCMSMHVIDGEGYSMEARKTTQGSFNWLSIKSHSNCQQFTKHMKTRQIKIAGALLDGDYDLETLPIDVPLCVTFGNEHRGLSKELIHQCDYHFSIPMFGMVESLNLSVAASITLYEITKRRREYNQQNPELNQDDYLKTKAYYYAKAISPRLLKGILNRDEN